MWLLNATTKHLRTFLPEDVPEYAILSHTWGSSADNEVLFSDFKPEGNVRALLPTARLKRSWKKVELTCAQALCDRYDWVWIDTCCIDKSSSSELSEAINSMYAWYRDSGVCYAYLSDVPADVCLKLSKSDFRRSRWFTRGWTLQELLAPSKVVFFVDKEDRPTSSGLGYHERTFGARTRWTQHASRPASPVPEARAIAGWRNIGEKTDLSDLIASITGIDIDILVDAELLGNASIAQRMSWASNRVTSRPEDMAYCLMGLFDVHMPMLYGEGAEKAFLRLQEEIMASSDDQSLFAWRDDNATADARYGLLARSPLFFRDSSRIVPYQDWQCRPPYQMTNRGLQVELPLTELPGQKGIYCAVLDCPVPPDYEDHCFLAIFLEKIPGSEVQFARVRANKFSQAWHPGQVQQIYVRQQQKAATKPTGVFPRHVFQLRKASLLRADYRAVDVLVPLGAEVTETLATQRGATQWIPDRKPQAFRIGKVPWAQVAGAILFEREEDGERLLVRFGSAGRAKVGFDAVRQLPRHRAGAQELDQDHLRRQVRDTFVPRKSGQTVELKHHRVRVNFAEPQVHGGSKYILIDLRIEAVSLADRTPVSPTPPLWDTITLLGEDSLEKTMSIRSKPPPPPPAQPKISTWRRLISKEPTPKPESLKPPKPFTVRHASSAGTLRELARWDGED